MLTWSGTAGIPFEWSNLTTAEQTALDAGDSSQTANRLQFLRGDQAEEIENGGVYRNLDSVLADIVDSSSSWVGPPSKSIYDAYETPATWLDKLHPSTTMAENSGQSYSTYVTAEATRQNVVYVGANDGFVHGFSAGSWDTTGTIYNSTTNTGQEVLAYSPQGALDNLHSASNSYLDYANPQYGHNFFVDATPGTGDLYYGGAWHTLGSRRPRRRRLRALCARCHDTGEFLRVQCRHSGDRRLAGRYIRDHQPWQLYLCKCDQLRPQSRQYLRYADGPAAAQRGLGAHLRQRPTTARPGMPAYSS